MSTTCLEVWVVCCKDIWPPLSLSFSWTIVRTLRLGHFRSTGTFQTRSSASITPTISSTSTSVTRLKNMIRWEDNPSLFNHLTFFQLRNVGKWLLSFCDTKMVLCLKRGYNYAVMWDFVSKVKYELYVTSLIVNTLAT